MQSMNFVRSKLLSLALFAFASATAVSAQQYRLEFGGRVTSAFVDGAPSDPFALASGTRVFGSVIIGRRAEADLYPDDSDLGQFVNTLESYRLGHVERTTDGLSYSYLLVDAANSGGGVYANHLRYNPEGYDSDVFMLYLLFEQGLLVGDQLTEGSFTYTDDRIPYADFQTTSFIGGRMSGVAQYRMVFDSLTVMAVPEPSVILLLATGLLLLLGLSHLRRTSFR